LKTELSFEEQQQLLAFAQSLERPASSGQIGEAFVVPQESE
jgi:hypothetical protein